MPDRIAPEARSRVMRSVKGRNTGPEMAVRRLVHKMGYRYRLHRKDLPGKPDLVFVGRRKVIFVNGCFWHGHRCKRGDRLPQTNREYWAGKIDRNVQRDKRNAKVLAANGWLALTIWECELKEGDNLGKRVRDFLELSPTTKSDNDRPGST